MTTYATEPRGARLPKPGSAEPGSLASTERTEPAAPVVPPTPALSLRDVRVRLRNGRRTVEVLRGIDLDVRPGELLGIIGPNGSGKSTLLRAVAGLVPSKGTIRAASGKAPKPRDLAIMAQRPELPEGMSVAEYALLGRTPHLGPLGRESAHDRRIVADVIRRLSLVDYADRPVSHLSGGEAQRVSLARALAQEAPVLLLDEPTSSLDLGIQDGVLALVNELRRRDGLTVVVAIHDLTAAARYADRLLLVHDGRAAALGTPGEVLRDDLLSEAFGAPLRVRRIDGEVVVLPSSRA